MRLPVFYRTEQAVNRNNSFSPSAQKPSEVVSDWINHKLAIEIHNFDPVARDDYYIAHSREYVEGVLNLVIDNGFHNTDAEIASSLFYTTGSMLAAAAHAVTHKTITCSPTSGFHHAGYRFGGDFCTFNGLMVTALKLQSLGQVKSVGILDCDAHYGNGTADIIEELGLTWVKHHTAGEFFSSIEDFGPNGSDYFKWLEISVDDVSSCDLVIYQAGADPHIEDPLGGFLTDQQLMSRDCMVFKGARRAKLPLVWNLAGGYRRDAEGGISPVLHTHRATAKMAIENQFDMYRTF